MIKHIRLAGACAVLLGTLPSCAVLAVAGVGVAVNQEFMENSVSYYVPTDVDTAWASAKRVVDSMTMEPIEADDQARSIEAIVQGSKVYVRVESFDIKETKVQVMAKRFGGYENDLAVDIAHRVRHAVAP